MLMLYLHSEFHMSSSSVALVIAIKLQAKCGLSTAAIILFFILQTKLY